MKKVVLLLVLLLSILANIYLVMKYRKDKKEPQSFRLENDKRISIIVKSEYKEFVMREMRTFVESLSLISDGMMEGDTAKIIRAGRRSGTGVEPPEELVEMLPPNFLKMGRPAHQLFEAIADSAKNNFNLQTTQKQINMLLVKCTACHSTYRFDTK